MRAIVSVTSWFSGGKNSFVFAVLMAVGGERGVSVTMGRAGKGVCQLPRGGWEKGCVSYHGGGWERGVSVTTGGRVTCKIAYHYVSISSCTTKKPMVLYLHMTTTAHTTLWLLSQHLP